MVQYIRHCCGTFDAHSRVSLMLPKYRASLDNHSSSIIYFILYRIASGALWILEARRIKYEVDDSTEQFAATASVLYLCLVVMHTIMTARMFVSFKVRVDISRILGRLYNPRSSLHVLTTNWYSLFLDA